MSMKKTVDKIRRNADELTAALDRGTLSMEFSLQ